MKTYRSAVAPVLSIILGSCWAGLMVMNLMSGDGSAILVLLALAVFYLYLYLSTTYTLDGSNLQVRCGFFIKERIEIGKINRITAARDFLAGPAFSFDRLFINYGKDRSIAISPRDRQAFLDDLRAINPLITIEGNKNA